MKGPTFKIVVALSLALGLGLFVALLVRLDFAQVWQHVSRVGWFFFLGLSAYVGGLLLTTWAWQSIIDSDRSTARYRDLVAAFWVGYSVNQLTPTANLGELYRAAAIKKKVQMQEVVASLITLSFLNMLVVQCFTLGGAILCLFFDELSPRVVWSVFGVGMGFFLPVIGLYAFIRLGIAEKVIALIQRLPLVKFKDPEGLTAKARSIDERVQCFRAERPGAFRRAVVALLGARILQVAEVFVFLLPLMHGQSWPRVLLFAIMTQTFGQLLTWVATVVPSQIGVAEGGSFLLFDLLGLDPLIGFSVAIVRRARWLLAVATGLLIGFWLGIRPSSTKRDGPGGDQQAGPPAEIDPDQ